MGPDALRIVGLAVALVAAAILLRSVLRDLRRPRQRPDPKADLGALYYVVIVAGCGATLLAMLFAFIAAPGAVVLSGLPFVAGLLAAASIRFAPGTHPVWHRLATRIKAAG
jgi:hypothetical protein